MAPPHPRPVTSGVVTIAPVEAVLAMVPDAMDLLTDAERTRAVSLRQASNRQAFLAVHVLVRLCAAHLFGTSVATTLVQHCPVCGGPHGAAHLRELSSAGLSMSRSGGVVAAAAAPLPVGVDVEPLDNAARTANLGQQVASSAERLAMARLLDATHASLLLWVRKEALAKVGRTTLDTMGDLDLSGLPLTLPTAGRHRRLRWDRYTVVDLSLESPASVGAVVSESEIDVVPLDRLGGVSGDLPDGSQWEHER